MPATLLDGDALAARLFAALTPRITALRDAGIIPRLATVLVGEDPASAQYITRKHANCAELGIGSDDIRLPHTDTADLLALVARLNDDPKVHGVMVQLPLPAGLDEIRIGEAIAPQKDVDGLHPLNLGRLLNGTPGLRPCTPMGILDLLRTHDIALQGARVAIIGRGTLVGRPLTMVLSQPGIDAEVTLLHRASRDLAAATRRADVVISAAGVPGLIRAEMIRPGAAVVGVGISFVDGAMVSDIAEDVADVAGHVTPRHGSIGALTRARLMRNLVEIAEGNGFGG